MSYGGNNSGFGGGGGGGYRQQYSDSQYGAGRPSGSPSGGGAYNRSGGGGNYGAARYGSERYGGGGGGGGGYGGNQNYGLGGREPAGYSVPSPAGRGGGEGHLSAIAEEGSHGGSRAPGGQHFSSPVSPLFSPAPSSVGHASHPGQPPAPPSSAPRSIHSSMNTQGGATVPSGHSATSVGRSGSDPSAASGSVPSGTDSSTRTTSDGLVNVADQLEALQLTSFYVRPGFGKEGRPLKVNSNYFAVRSLDGRGKIIYHYDVDIVPVVKSSTQKQPRTLLRAVWEQFVLDQSETDWATCISAAAFDGRRNVFSPIKFPIPSGESVVLSTALNPNREVRKPRRDDSSSDDEFRRFKLAFKLVAKIDLEHVMQFCRADKHTPKSEEAALTGVMCTNVLLRDFPSKRYAQVGATGNKFFTIDGARPIPNGAVVCRGFLQSFRYSNSGYPLINIDLGFSAFLSSGPGLDVIQRILTGRPIDASGMGLDSLDERQTAILKRKLRGARFTVTHRPSTRLHTVITVTLKPACEVLFQLETDGKQRYINIPDYYKEYYGAPVRKPRLPCIQYGKSAFVPIEFVNFADFNSLPPTNLTPEQTAEMIKIAAIKPVERAKAVMAWRRELDYENQKKIAAWGLQVNTNMVEINARILSPPDVQYRRQTARVDNGQWRIRGQQFIRPINRPLVNWAVVSFDRHCDISDMQRWISFLCQRLSAFGVEIGNSRPQLIPPSDPRNPDNLIGALQKAARAAYMVDKQTPQLILVILPGKDAWLYESIKKLAFTELNAPVATQCMQAAKIKNERGIDAYTDNLAMKIAAKLGGLSHAVLPRHLPGVVQGRTMILGADLGHPPVRPGQESRSPTVACSIATYNADCNAFSAQIRLQHGRSEVIQDLSNMVEEHLRIFAKNNEGNYPERILIFRDGISEGQYAATLQYEHDAVVKACARVEPNYRPRILICVCAKRHNTRFFGTTPTDLNPRTGNLPAGLVVDSTVTHPYAFDFFLQAHAGLVGTARPTHYICLLDELGLTPDQLQKLVHGLCHSFARCTSSVSLVPVCYMADLVCQKARVIVQKATGTATPSVTSGTRTNFRGDDGMSQFSASRAGDHIDISTLQTMLSRNPELSQVAWWM